jgi:hypothetical protein
MTNLEKLGNAIKELEMQSNDLKDFNKVYSEIGKLQGRIYESLTLLKDNNDGFSTISTEVKSRLEESKKQVARLESKLLKMIQELYLDIKNFQEESKKQVSSIESKLLKKIQELYQDNKNFQKELDLSLISRLDKHKSDIQVEIRNEGAQIQRGFETTLNSNFSSMELKLKEFFDVQSKELKTLKILVFILIIIATGMGIALAFLILNY